MQKIKRKYNTHIKKSLGQNFLKDKLVLNKIISISDIKNDDNILEIGTGEGDLTKEILKYNPENFISLEIDKNLYDLNKNAFINHKNLQILNENILDFNIPYKNFDFKVIANIPYYITSPILHKLLLNKNLPSDIILMVQKEIAEKIIYKNNKHNLLSLLVYNFGQVEKKIQVSKHAFYPVPKVDSTVIKIKLNKNPIIKNFNTKFKFIKNVFQNRRKNILNNLNRFLHLDKKIILEKLEKLNISYQKRPEDIIFLEWDNLYEEFNKD